MKIDVYQLRRLLKFVDEFESNAHLDIDVILKTSGKVKLLIRDPGAGQQTQTFATVLAAVEWVQEVM